MEKSVFCISGALQLKSGRKISESKHEMTSYRSSDMIEVVRIKKDFKNKDFTERADELRLLALQLR